MVIDGKIDPCLGDVFQFEEIGRAHYEMEAGAGSYGNRVALIGAPEPGQGRR
jgi:crotonyl-CoA carboxylase/reductase